jgi:hypothetical protein
MLPIAEHSLAGVLGATAIGPDAIALATGAGVATAQIKLTDLIGAPSAAVPVVARH